MLVTRSTAKQVHLECNRLKSKVRFGHAPDAHHLFDEWMRLDESLSVETSHAKCRCYERQCRVLLDAICDELVPTQWRCACLDQINKPLRKLLKLSKTDEQQRDYLGLTREIRVCSHYVQQSLQTQPKGDTYLVEKTLGMIAQKTNQNR